MKKAQAMRALRPRLQKQTRKVNEMPNTDILAQKPYAVPRRGMGQIYYTLLRKREDPAYWQSYLDWLSEKATWDPAYMDDLAEAMVR